MTFRQRLHTAGNDRRVRTAVWVASVVLAVLLAVALLIVAVLTYQKTRRPPAPPVKYYYTVQGPSRIFQQQPTEALLAEALHSALNLPASYPPGHITVWFVFTDPSNTTDLEAKSAPPPTQQQVSLLKNSSAQAKLLFGFQLAPAPDVPDTDTLSLFIASDDSNTAVLLFLTLPGLIDAAALGTYTAGFSTSTGNILGRPAGSIKPSTIPDTELLQYPPRPMPDNSCTCRHGWNMTRVPMNCPSPWESMAGTQEVPPALAIANGSLVEQHSKQPALLHGVNWFGWSVGTFDFDGLWAYCDDNSQTCEQDGDIPPQDAVGPKGMRALNISYWGKRRLTNDFAAVVYRAKLLGFNAVRVQFKFSDLNEDLPQVYKGALTEFSPCLLDSDEYIALNKTLDPKLSTDSSNHSIKQQLLGVLPKYKGMPHPPPRTGTPQCDSKPWSAPIMANVTTRVPLPAAGRSGNRSTGNTSLGNTTLVNSIVPVGMLNLTMCNWYLPQGPGVPALYRFLWQLQYFISQGLYVLLDFSSRREEEPNLQHPELLAKNWGNFWRVLTDIPAYKKHMAGRIFPDLVNEPSRFGCQWQTPCQPPDGPRTCAPILHSYGLAAAAIWKADPHVPIFINGLGQDHNSQWWQCGGLFPGMHWGDGFVTSSPAVQQYGISEPSKLLNTLNKMSGAGVVLAPHIYPASITKDEDVVTQHQDNFFSRWDLSWGLKAQGADTDPQGSSLPHFPVVIGEFGAKDLGNNSNSNTDTTQYSPADSSWLKATAEYLRLLAEKTHQPTSWFFWAWNANSGDTHGVVGPATTWREVQWTKIRMLIREFGLRPWYCDWQPSLCSTVEW